MHRSSAFESITDPDDPAWYGHAQLPARPWWMRREVHAAAAVVGVLAVASIIGVLVARSGGEQPEVAPTATRATPAATIDSPSPVPPPVETNAANAAPKVPAAAARTSRATGQAAAAPRSHFAPGTAYSYVFEAGGSGGARFGDPGAVTGKEVGLGPSLSAGLEGLAVMLGRPLTIISGHRSREEQEILYRRFQAGTGNLAAVPGTSRHETGDAADVYVDGVALADVPGAKAMAASLGLGFPVPGEPWHVERVASIPPAQP